MKRANKDRVVNICLLVIGVVFLTLSIKLNISKNEVNKDYKKGEAVNKGRFAMYIEGDNGNYVEYESNVFPSGYILNLNSSKCIDINNNVVEGALNDTEDGIIVMGNKTMFCYLYFDDDKLLTTKIMNLTGQTVGDGTVINVNEDEYRYSGSNPNNFITFNNETWRIIGIVDGYVKIIRNDSLGYFSWDYKQPGVGSSVHDCGSNDWTDSQLMMMLNPTEYLKTGYTISNNMVYDSKGNLAYSNMGSYYNGASGYKPASIATGATSYGGAAIDFSSAGLNETSRYLIQENVWYLSDPTGGDFPGVDFTAEAYYVYERNGQNTYGENPITWRGKVGLVYISDYLYANNNYYSNPDTYDFSADCEDNWMCGFMEWTISHYSMAEMNVLLVHHNNFVIDDSSIGGTLSLTSANSTLSVRPVVYLKSGIKVTGTGTIDSKYQIIS